MIVYTMELVSEIRRLRESVLRAGYFCYDNGVTVKVEDRNVTLKILSEAMTRLEQVRPPKRSAKEGIQDAKRRGHLG